MDDKDLRIQELKVENEKLKKQMAELKENNLDPIELCKVSIALDKLKEYQRLEEQGLLLKLPCKIGDKVKLRGCCEILCSFKGCAFEDSCEFDKCNNENEREFITTVESIYNEGNGWHVTLKYIAFPIPIIDFGKNVFLTEQEAQVALKDMKTLDNIGELEQELMELEENHCSSCSNQFNISLCEGCDVSSHKNDLQQLINSLRE